MDKVSIIIPIYNGAKYIDRTISRLLKQSYVNIEIICICNGCTDHSLELCLTWQKRDCRVKAIANEEKGTSLARKRGVYEATGSYIVFMDCDDLYFSKMAIQKMVDAIKEDDVEICQFDYIVQYPIPFFLRRISVVPENKIYNRSEMLGGAIPRRCAGTRWKL